jgi:hypothetical protein
MATPKSGNLVKLYLRESGSTTAFKYVVCNTTLSLDGTAEEISTNTKCGVLKAAGTTSFEIPFAGVTDYAGDAGTISANNLYNWFAAGQLLDFVIGDAATAGTVLDFSGTASITALAVAAEVDNFVSFDGNLSVNGTPVNGI